jgi:hypothetical protein
MGNRDTVEQSTHFGGASLLVPIAGYSPGGGLGGSVPEFTAEITYPNAYTRMISAFRDRAAQRHIAMSSAAVADVAGVANYYFPKLLQANPVRRVGINSLGPLLAVLGLKIILVEDIEAVTRYGPRIPVATESCTRMLTVRAGRGKQQLVSVKMLRRIAPLGGAARNRSLSPAQRSQIARKGGLAKWAKAKAAAKAAKRKAQGGIDG